MVSTKEKKRVFDPRLLAVAVSLVHLQSFVCGSTKRVLFGRTFNWGNHGFPVWLDWRWRSCVIDLAASLYVPVDCSGFSFLLVICLQCRCVSSRSVCIEASKPVV